MTNNTKNSKVLLSDRLASDNYLKLTYPLLRAIQDADIAVFLTFLMNMDQFNENKKQKDKKGFFLATRTFVEKTIGITKGKQLTASLKLVELGLIEVERRAGMPARIWIKLNHQTIIDFLDKHKELEQQLEDDFTPVEGYIKN